MYLCVLWYLISSLYTPVISTHPIVYNSVQINVHFWVFSKFSNSIYVTKITSFPHYIFCPLYLSSLSVFSLWIDISSLSFSLSVSVFLSHLSSLPCVCVCVFSLEANKIIPSYWQMFEIASLNTFFFYLTLSVFCSCLNTPGFPVFVTGTSVSVLCSN